jgi:hypothetical protein
MQRKYPEASPFGIDCHQGTQFKFRSGLPQRGDHGRSNRLKTIAFSEMV